MSAKRGIAWPLQGSEDSLDLFHHDQIRWFYNWSSDKTSDIDIEFVPMLWTGNNGADADQFAEKVRSQGATHALGFNEPERSEQANMSPSDAAQIWKQYVEPLRNQGIRLGSPSIASTEEGLNWLQQFLNEGCQIDFLALHWYGRGVDNFIDYITSARERFGSRYPVWITEFSCTSWNPNEPVSQDEINQFFDQSLARLDATDWVERYAWFGASRHLDAALGSGNCLISDNGQLSELGRKYVGA
ncbi:unnamed protein product [Adineta steineri]|uniref:Asl1-like glycosyl hydrolase catalytic domain-containing protein n=1 Tax=Adineta steineri TaxID=433720 RepID=A0A820HY51_9BILA|nr:unnamed protein product [Adineta steineri]CAF4303559.1 unnamed protein product [Adineta steineri]